MLDPGNAEDDLILDVIVLVGAVCVDNECAGMLSQSGIIETLIDMLNGMIEKRKKFWKKTTDSIKF